MPTTNAHVPEVSDLDIAFPCRHKELLPAWESLSPEEQQGHTIYCEAASRLFFRGGMLEEAGVRVRDDVDASKVYRYLRATLGDYGPSHDWKIAGVGHMLARWCEPTTKTP